MTRDKFQSDDEYYIWHWLMVMERHGWLCKVIYEPEPFILFEGQKLSSVVKTRTGKDKTVTKTLLRDTRYTPDYYFEFNEKLHNILYSTESTFALNDKLPIVACTEYGACYFEVKPSFDFKNMQRLVVDKIKWLYDRYKIYINIVKCEELFKATFAPPEYHLTLTGKVRIGKHNPLNYRTYQLWSNVIQRLIK